MVTRFFALAFVALHASAAVAANVAPTVALTAPAPNAKLVAPAAVTLSASAADKDGKVAKVGFYSGATLLGSVTASPYNYSWTNVATGTSSVTAKVTDNAGTVTTSAPLVVTVSANALPTVSMSAVPTGSPVAPATITLNAAASDSDGTIVKIAYYNGATLIGSATAAPYAVVWSNVATGSYSLVAKATDDRGGVATSASVAVVVKANVAPTVSIATPLNNASFAAPGVIRLTASAADSDGNIAKVAFYQGTVLIGTATAAPYTFTWAGAATGSYSITAKATDDKGAVTTSVPISVTVKANLAPTVSIASPTKNASFAAPANISLNANAADSDGTIAKVAFYQGTSLIGTATSGPYTATWTGASVGTYSITAKATDDKGTVTTSPAVSIIVKANAVPTVSMTEPANNSTFLSPGTITLSAAAADSDGNIASVAFYSGAALLGSTSKAPYTYSWTSAQAGSYSITAKATDDNGTVTTSAPVTLTVRTNTSPTVNITSPANNASYYGPVSVPLSAAATDSDGTVRKVDFYNGSTLVGSAATAPFDFMWANVAVGNYSITAKATDDSGAVATSAPVSVAVLAAPIPAVSISAPANNASYVAPASITLIASASVTDGTVNKVEFLQGGTVVGTVTAPPYTITMDGIRAGSYTFSARATGNNGGVGLSAPLNFKVVDNAAPIISIAATPANSVAPAAVTLTAVASDTDGSIAKVEFFNGQILLATLANAPYTFQWSDVAAGSYSITARATDNLNSVTTSVGQSVVVTTAPGSVQVFYIFGDQINTAQEITNAAGQKVWQADPEPFGSNPPNENPSGNGQFTYNLRFPGQYFDRETGLHYNYYRDYDPQTGRYVQSDPIGLSGGVNTYAYVGGNPLSNVDPSGLLVAPGLPPGLATLVPASSSTLVTTGALGGGLCRRSCGRIRIQLCL